MATAEERATAKAQLATEKGKIAARRKIIRKEMKNTVKCRVSNLEDPGKKIPIEFDFEGTHFKYEDGHEYDIPVMVVDHLNNRTYPVYDLNQDPESKETSIISQVVGQRPRFSVQPVNLGRAAA